MVRRCQRDFLQAQILEIQRLRELARGHPLMSIALEEREQEFRVRLATLPADEEKTKEEATI